MIDLKNIDSSKVYNYLTPEEAQKRMNEFQAMFDTFLKKSSLDRSDIECNDVMLMKIITRIDQRSDYFVYFHSEVDNNGKLNVDVMSQYKQVALLCYWIIKYKPLRVKEHHTDIDYYCQNRCTINETFAAYIFISQINSSQLLSKKQKQYYKSWGYTEDLFYKFMHHDISKEAMIFSLCSIVCCK